MIPKHIFDIIQHICCFKRIIYATIVTTYTRHNTTYMLMPCIIYVRCCETYMCDCERICSVIPQHMCDVIQHICCFTENIPYYCLNIYVHNLTYMTLSPTYTVYIVTYMLIKSSYMMIHEDMDYFIEYNLYAVTYMYQNPTYVVRVFHSSSDSSVDASPTVKQRFTGLSVPGSDNKEMITRFLFLFTASPGRYSMVSSLSSPTSCNYMHGCHTRTIYVGFV